jgi:cytochrome c oxidase subunit 2
MNHRRNLGAAVLAVLIVCAAGCSGSDDAASRGRALVIDLGCTVCHTGADSGLGPAWEGRWGIDRPLDDGTTVPFDAGYVRRSLEAPREEVAAGYAPTMPGFSVTDAELADITAYLESLASP